MTEFSKLVDAVNCGHLVNSDGSFKLDSIGRRRHVNQSPGRPKSGRSMSLDKNYMIRMDDIMHSELADKAKQKDVKVSTLIRDYIEWGLENDE